MLNPNGFETISKIMQSHEKRAKIKRYSSVEKEPEHKSLFVENDGGIMGPMWKLIFNVYRCS